jgi:hypothetical protein
MDTHTNLRRLTFNGLCDKGELVANGSVLICAADAQWLVDFGPESVGAHPRCEVHAVKTVKAWAGFEAAEKKRAS